MFQVIAASSPPATQQSLDSDSSTSTTVEPVPNSNLAPPTTFYSQSNLMMAQQFNQQQLTFLLQQQQQHQQQHQQQAQAQQPTQQAQAMAQATGIAAGLNFAPLPLASVSSASSADSSRQSGSGQSASSSHSSDQGPALDYMTVVGSPAAAAPALVASLPQSLTVSQLFPQAQAQAGGGPPTNPLLSHPTISNAALPLLPGGSVPEFLYQLVKMLTDPANRSIIEWTAHLVAGRIEVHRPDRLEKEVLGRYFRHSRYASFQRQLNYFGFRKNAGKGKMSPCSYVNAGATRDVLSLLTMKRRNGGRERGREGKAQEKQQQAMAAAVAGGVGIVSGFAVTVPPAASAQPMFAASATATVTAGIGTAGVDNTGNNEAFDTMAATIARKISCSSTATAATMVSNASNHDRSNATFATFDTKRVKPNGSLPAPSAMDGRGYTVVVGGGVRHQLNGYLRAAAVPPAAVDGSLAGHLSRPTAPAAPLRFQEPSELGMSLEGSLSQLRASFAAAGGGPHSASHGIATAVSASTSSASSSFPYNAGFKVKIAPSALTRRVSPHFLGGMLHRDDSLINLAMLPTLDTTTTAAAPISVHDDAPAAVSEGVSGGGSDARHRDYTASMFSRDDSLANLAAMVEMVGGAGAPSSALTPTIAPASKSDSLANFVTVAEMMGQGGAGLYSSTIASSSRNHSLVNLAAVVDMIGPGAGSCYSTPPFTIDPPSSGDAYPTQSDTSLSGEGRGGETFSFIDFQ